MRISDPKKFKRRVQVPLSFPLFALGAYIGMFANIFYGGEPITLFVVMVIFGLALSVISYDPRKNK